MMATDKRLSRGERSGRYGPDNMRDDMDWHERRRNYMERDYDQRRADDRHRDRLDDCRDSPERSRKRRHCDSSDDEYDGSRPDQDHKTLSRERNKPIELRGLPPNTTEEEIRAALEQLEGPQPAGIVVYGNRTGKTEEFAVMEFYHMQDSTRWMETNQTKLEIQGRTISVKYSHKRAMYENWLCNSCGLCNLKKRPRCFKCGLEGGSPAVDSINVEPQQESDDNTDTLILRNLAPISSVDGILNMLSPYANLTASNIRLLNHKQTRINKSLGFVQLSSPLEASQLLTILQSLQPPLKLDGKTVAVNYAKSVTRNGAKHCGKRATNISVASTAITAAHWSSSQLQPGSNATSDYVTPPEGFSQQSQEQKYQVWQQQHLKGLSLVNGDGFPGAAPGMQTSVPPATAVVISQTAQIYQPVVFSQTAIQSHHVAMAVDAELQQQQSVRRDGEQPGGMQANVISVASTAITAAHWSSSQLQPGSNATSDYVTPPEGFSQQSQEQKYQVWQQQHQKGLSLVNGDGFPGAAPGMQTSVPPATAVVISQTAQIYQPVVFSQTAIQSHHVATAVDAEQQQQHHNHHHHHQQQPQPQHHHHQQQQQQQPHQQPQPQHHHHHQQHPQPQHHNHQQQQPHQQQTQQQPQHHHHLHHQQPHQQQPHQQLQHHHQQQPQHHQQQQPQQLQHQQQQQHHHQQQQQQQQPQQLQHHHQQQPQQLQHHHQQQPQQLQPQQLQHHQQQQPHHQKRQQQQHHPASVSTAPPVTPTASSVSTTVSASPSLKSAAPDMSTFQFDQDSGYYYDPQIRLYYDPSSQYYYNSGTQQYLYWDGEKQTYVQATEEMMAEQNSSSEESKIKKKPKTRSSQQISENMQRWIKRLNKQIGSSKSSVQDLGPSKEEDKKCSAPAVAGSSLLEEKQSRDFETPSLMNEQFKILEQSDPFVSYNGVNEPEEGSMDGSADEEGRITDWRTGVCLLCQRRFPTKDALLRHQQLSDLHKQNLEIQRRSRIPVAEQEKRDSELKYRDRAAERRGKSGAYTANKEFQPPTNYGKPTNNGLTRNNIGNHRFQVTGWHKASDLGFHQ